MLPEISQKDFSVFSAILYFNMSIKNRGRCCPHFPGKMVRWTGPSLPSTQGNCLPKYSNKIVTILLIQGMAREMLAFDFLKYNSKGVKYCPFLGKSLWAQSTLELYGGENVVLFKQLLKAIKFCVQNARKLSASKTREN